MKLMSGFSVKCAKHAKQVLQIELQAMKRFMSHERFQLAL